MLEIDDELRDIKQEIIESRALIIRTNNLTNTLGSDLKAIAKRQQAYETRLSWNSATAYVAFVIVSFIMMKFAWDARVASIRSDTDHKVAENERLRKENGELRRSADARAHAEEKAFMFSELIRERKRAEIVEQFDAIRNDALSKAEMAYFSEAVERSRTELAAHAYYAGVERAQAKHWREAATSLEESLKWKDDATTSLNAKLLLAEAYRQSARPKEAITLLAPMIDLPQKDVANSALYQIAWAQIETKSIEDAKNSLRTLIRRAPEGSRVLHDAKTVLSQLP